MMDMLFDRRGALRLGATGLLLCGTTARGRAGVFDSVELDRRAKVLSQSTLVIPAASASGVPGVAGADVVCPRRGFFGIDWAISDKRELTVMMVTERQKSDIASGRRLSGQPLMRIPVQGPEVAGQNITVTGGRFFVAFLNAESSPARIAYRTSFQAF